MAQNSNHSWAILFSSVQNTAINGSLAVSSYWNFLSRFIAMAAQVTRSTELCSQELELSHLFF